MGYKLKLPIKTPHYDYSFYYLKPEFNLDFGVILGSDLLNIHHSAGYDVEAEYMLALPVKPSFSVDFGRRFDNEKIVGGYFFKSGS